MLFNSWLEAHDNRLHVPLLLQILQARDSVTIRYSFYVLGLLTFLRVKGNLEGGGDGFSNTSLVLVEHGHHQSFPADDERMDNGD